MGCWNSKTNPRNEPTAVRGCTDTFWLCLYILFWFFMIIIAAFAFVYGNPIRLLNGYDSFGNTCGQKYNIKMSDAPLSGLNTAQKPFLFFLDVTEFKKTLKICIKHCPDRYINSSNELYKFYKDTETNLCRYDFDINIFNNQTIINSGNDYTKHIFNIMGPCPTLPVYKSEPVLHRCVPVIAAGVAGGIIGNIYAALNSWGAAEQLLGDLYNAWPYMLACSGLAFLLSLGLISVLHILTSLISWLILILVGASCISATAVLWWTYIRIKNNLDITPDYQLLQELTRNETAILTFSAVATVITVFILLIIWVLKGKLAPLAALFKEAGTCLGSIPGLIVPPLVASVVLVAFFTFWVTVVICLATANYPGVKPLLPIETKIATDGKKVSISENDPLYSIYKSNTTYTLVEYLDADWLRYMWWFYLIGLIWTSEFILACLHMTVAGAVAHWYFSKPNSKDSPVLNSICKLIKYHLGSVALGSLLITSFKIPRLILTYLYTKLKQQESLGSTCAECCLKCCICCFWSLEKFIRYLNHNAYTVIAIESVNFCPASGIAWNALMSNALQVATINGIGDFILFLGKVAVSAVCGIAALFLLRDHPDVHFFAAPVLLICVFAFLIAHCVLSLYEIVVDTLFLCVCEDRTINGEAGRWKDSALAELVGGIQNTELQSAARQPLELQPITKQPA